MSQPQETRPSLCPEATQPILKLFLVPAYCESVTQLAAVQGPEADWTKMVPYET